MYELSLGPIKPILKQKRSARPKIIWDDDKLSYLNENFANSFNKDIAKHLSIGWRSVVRKARELQLEKEDGFLDNHRDVISKMATDSHPEHPHKGDKGWCVPNSLHTRFKPGHISEMANNRELVLRVHEKRNATIKSERIRIRIGLQPKTKMKLKF